MDCDEERLVANPPLGLHGDRTSHRKASPGARSLVSPVRKLLGLGDRRLSGADVDVDVVEDPSVGDVGCHCQGALGGADACFAGGG
jgi:hypothetical protein